MFLQIAALFFVSYEGTKRLLKPICPYDTVSQMTAASVGEVVACFVRVPVEVVKQRTQARGRTSWFNFVKTLKSEGFRGLYRGYGTTVAREIPFSLIQFPLWEYLKYKFNRNSAMPIQPWKATLCGALAGGTSAFLTTPLDVAKTRVILAERSSHMATLNIGQALSVIWKQSGIKGLVHTRYFVQTKPRSLFQFFCWCNTSSSMDFDWWSNIPWWLRKNCSIFRGQNLTIIILGQV